MDTAPHVEVRVAERVAASAERVFDAWLDPATAGKWLFATAWRPMASVTIDARAGGAFRLAERLDGKGAVHTGRYVEIVKPRRLVFAISGGERSQAPVCASSSFRCQRDANLRWSRRACCRATPPIPRAAGAACYMASRCCLAGDAVMK